MPHRSVGLSEPLRALIIAAAFSATAFAQSENLNLQPVTTTAGEAGFTRIQSSLAPGSRPAGPIVTLKTTPSLKFPIRVEASENAAGDFRVVVPPATPPGQYDIEVAGRDRIGRPVTAALHVTVKAVTVTRPPNGRVPVILLNGWQWQFLCSNSASTLVASRDTFGTLADQLQGIPVLFFNNCVYGDQSIEDLGAELGNYIAGLRYTDNTPVPAVDLVAHSMGGLIVRAYLAGLQSNQTLTPPANPQVRKFVEIATPNFGSFIATNIGVQVPEMLPGSVLLWNLATWNQRGDDLRGVDSLAIIGNAGSCCSAALSTIANASDGVVSTSSASLNFARDVSRTRILPYCHTDATLLANCSGQPIANVDKAPETGQIILSFLADTNAWQSIGTTPATDPLLSQYGGIYFADVNAAGQYLRDLTQVSFGSGSLQNGGAANTVYFAEFGRGTNSFAATSQSAGAFNCGPVTVQNGGYNTFRCKSLPVISSVGQLIQVSAKIVRSGGIITLTGAGFGAQKCQTCQVLAYPGAVALQIQSWSDQSISANLPVSFNGDVVLTVQAAAGSDSINIVAAPTPSFTISPTTATFSAAGGNGTLTVTASLYDVPWQALVSDPWITITSGTPGAGSGTVAFTVAPNSGAQRSGWVYAVGQYLTITQSAGHPAFFSGEIPLSNGVYYLQFGTGNLFGYYSYLPNSFIYHFDMGYEYVSPAPGGAAYLYDFASGHWFYTSPALFPYLYDFTYNAWLFYFPDTANAGHYTANPRYFAKIGTSQILSF